MVSIPSELKQFVKIKTSLCEAEGFHFDIETYTVIPTNSKGELTKKYSYDVLDDNTYVKYPELIKLIPRGLSLAFYNGIEICKLDGLEKFDGSCPLDDDDLDHNNFGQLPNIFKQNAIDIANWTNLKVEFLEKANGKMAIFKVFKMAKQYFILGGSKNVHIVVGIHEDIKGLELHHGILKKFQTDVSNIVDLDSLVNKTIIGEYIDGRHIIFVEKPYLVYFSGPLMNIGRLFPDQTTIPTVEQLEHIRNLENSEGAVITYTNLDTGIVFRQKHKSIWYILIRVMREGLRHFKKDTPVDIILTKVYGIFKKRSDDFLNLSDANFIKWHEILQNFILFIKHSKYEFTDLDNQNLGIGAVYHEFVNCDPSGYNFPEEYTDTSITRRIELITRHNASHIASQPFDSLENPELVRYIEALHGKGIKICVIMRGVTGSGKSTCIKALTELLPELVSFSTDDLFKIDGVYTFDPKKLGVMHDKNFENFKNAVLLENKPIVCVDNTNIEYFEYSRYIELAKNNGYVTVVLQCKKYSAETLASRSTHEVPIQFIIPKVQKYKFVEPSYMGIFLNTDEIKELLKQPKEVGFDFIPKQTTPLHITLFYGRTQINSEACKAIEVGKEFDINIYGLCTSKAGKFLKVAIENFDNLHVTLETFETFKPVDVGIFPAETTIATIILTTGIYGPIY